MCGYCGYLMLFSVKVLSRPGTTDEIGRRCPICETPLNLAFLATELDIDEVVEVDLKEIERAVARVTGYSSTTT